MEKESAEEIVTKKSHPYWSFAWKVIIILALAVIWNARRSGFDDPASGLKISGGQDMQVKSLVLGDENTAPEPVLASEDFQIKQMTLGGDMSMELNNLNSSDPLSISDVKSDIYYSKGDQNDISAVISWETNKMALSQVSIGKNSESASNDIKEDEYAYSHTIVAPNLDPGSVYSFQVTAQDQSGQGAESNRFAFYSGAPNISLIDVLQNAARKVFGWAMK